MRFILLLPFACSSVALGAPNQVQLLRTSQEIPNELLSKTLFELGTIAEIHIYPSDYSGKPLSADNLLKTLNEVFATFKISLWSKTSVADGIAPKFRIVYTNGMVATGDRFTAIISSPKLAESVRCLLLQSNTAEQGAAANP